MCIISLLSTESASDALLLLLCTIHVNRHRDIHCILRNGVIRKFSYPILLPSVPFTCLYSLALYSMDSDGIMSYHTYYIHLFLWTQHMLCSNPIQSSSV